MCGIAGLWRFNGAPDTDLRSDICRMTDAVAYRGPDGEGQWIDGGVGIALGHRRLAIVDLSPTGFQPMTSASGRIVISYNGELYNTADIAAELAMPFRGRSDTEVLVEAIDRFGIDGALQRANGLFAFAAFDRSRRVLHLARDRLGIKPLYWSRQNGSFAFASELKAIRALPSLALTLDRQALAAYLRHSCVPAPWTIFSEVAKLLPGERIEVTPNGVDKRLYWDIAAIARRGQAQQTTRPFEAVVDELDALLADAVKRQMISDVPLGAFLSGGIDSSTVVALMRAAGKGAVKTFSIGFKEQGFNEADYARDVARHLGTDHTELELSASDALAIVPLLPRMYDEPFADSSQLPTFLVSRLARQHVTVALSGDGGDETFAGYVRYRGIAAAWRGMRHLPQSIRRAARHSVEMLSAETWDRIGGLLPRRLRPAHFGDKMLKTAALLDAGDPIEMYRRLITQWPEPDKLQPGIGERPGWIEQFAGRSEGMALDARLRLLDMMSYLPDDILTKVDRAAMSVSLEVRVPLIDHRVIEYAWGLPTRYLIDRGQGKRVLRAVLERYVPRSLFERPKMGFGMPVGMWLRGPLRGWAEDLLAPDLLAQDGLFDAALVRRRWEEHCSGRRNWQYALWAVLQFQAWRLSGNGSPRGDGVG